MFSVCVLCYGDYPELAERCLGSVEKSRGWAHVADVRVGLNEVSARTDAYVRACLGRLPVRCLTFRPERNVGKYPLMRRMFYDVPLAGHVMWFDDDAFLFNKDRKWWEQAAAVAATCDVAGHTYRLRGGFRPGQLPGIRAQPWYAGKPIREKWWPPFPQGSWWIARSDLLRRWDFPFKELHHNGGDSILGELCHQQGLRFVDCRYGVAVNYDASRGGHSGALRRGITSPWPFEREAPAGLHDFALRLEDKPAVCVKEASA